MVQPINLLYICGSGRSGSTVLDLLLGGLPGVCSLGEVHSLPETFAERATALCSCGRILAECPLWGLVFAEFGDQLGARARPRSDPYLSRWWIGRELSEVLRYSLFGRLPTARSADIDLQQRMLRRIADETASAWLSDSSKKPLRLLHLLASAAFDVRVIYLVRDAREVMLAKRKATAGRTAGAARATIGWMYQNLMAAALYRRVAPDRRFRLDYERLVGDPRGALQAIVDRFGLDVEVSAEQAQILVPSARHLAAGNRLRLLGTQPVELRSGLAGLTWRDHLMDAMVTRPFSRVIDHLT